MTSKEIPETENSTLYVQTFGGLCLSVADVTLCENINRTRLLWSLLGFLIANRHTHSTSGDLIAALWPDGGIENASGALKNLVYRLRGVFSEYGLPYARSIILYSQGHYHWNNKLPCVVDCEEFEVLALRGQDATLSQEERLSACRGAVEYYKGDFLPACAYETWAAEFTERYRALYFKCLYPLCQSLMLQRQFEYLCSLCELAVKIDPFEELAQKYLMYALFRTGRQGEAISHYRYVTDLYFCELGVRPSAMLQKLYHEISRSSHVSEVPISQAKNELTEQPGEQSAYFCEYEVFKSIYRLFARSVERTGQTSFIASVCASCEPPGFSSPRERAIVMEKLLASIRVSLRQGDVITRLSPVQYLLLLPNLCYEEAQAVLARIIRCFRKERRLTQITLACSIEPMDPYS